MVTSTGLDMGTSQWLAGKRAPCGSGYCNSVLPLAPPHPWSCRGSPEGPGTTLTTSLAINYGEQSTGKQGKRGHQPDMRG